MFTKKIYAFATIFLVLPLLQANANVRFKLPSTKTNPVKYPSVVSFEPSYTVSKFDVLRVPYDESTSRKGKSLSEIPHTVSVHPSWYEPLLGKDSNLTSLNLGGQYIGGFRRNTAIGFTLAELAEKLPGSKLKTLNLSINGLRANSEDKADSSNDLAILMPKVAQSEIENLYLGLNSLKGDWSSEAKEGLKRAVSLKKLDLGDSEIDDTTLESFVGHLPSSLEHLDLSENDITTAGLRRVASKLRQYSRALTIDLTGNNISSNELPMLQVEFPNINWVINKDW